MTPAAATVRPVPTWVRVWGVVTASVALLMLFVLGGFVTSFRVGMADPVWPTEPWYLVDKDWQRLEFGFLVEHTHRAAGWIVGALVTVFALAVWATEPRPGLRWAGLGALVLLLVNYGQFHRGMMAAEAARRAEQSVETIKLPKTQGAATILAAAACVVCAGLAVAGEGFGRWARGAAVMALLAVMVQGLLGGFRVFLDQLYGTQLAAYHGAFAQVVFALLVTTVFLCAPRRPGDALPKSERTRLRSAAVALPAVLFLQLIWGVWLRHHGSPVAQRLHLMTAFLAAVLAVWVAARSLQSEAGRRHLGFLSYHLLGILAVQLLLGVEAWMGKFAAAGRYAATLPMDRPVTTEMAAIRTGHVVIGTALLAASVVFALRAGRGPLGAEPDSGVFPFHGESTVRLGEPISLG